MPCQAVPSWEHLSHFRPQKTGPVAEFQMKWDSFVGGKCDPVMVFQLVHSAGTFCFYNQTQNAGWWIKDDPTWVCLFVWQSIQPHVLFQSFLGTINTCSQTCVSLINPNWKISSSKYFYNRTKQECLMALKVPAPLTRVCIQSWISRVCYHVLYKLWV